MLHSFFAGVAGIFVAITGFFNFSHPAPATVIEAATSTIDTATSTTLLATTTKDSTDTKFQKLQAQLDAERSERLKLQNQINTTQNNTSQKPAPTPTQSTPTYTTTSNQQVTSQPVQDYKLQALAILRGAIDNYSRLYTYSLQAASVVENRKSLIFNLYQDNADFIPTITDPTAKKMFEILGDMFETEMNYWSPTQKLYKFDYPKWVNDSKAAVNQIINTIESSSQPISYDQMQSYQITYFGSSLFENNRQSLTQVEDSVKSKIAEFNKNYSSALSIIQKYIDSQTTLSRPYTVYVPPTPIYPVLPTYTTCYAQSHGYGSATVNCTTY